MKVFFVGAGPGDPELLTIKAKKLLQDCRICIYAGSLVNPEIIDLLPKQAERHNSAEMDLKEIGSIFQQAKQKDMDVVRLHSGDPSIYGAIREQMNELDKMGIDYEVIPGVSSFQAAAAALKVELTAPEVSQTIVLTRTSGRTPVPPEQAIPHLAATRSSLCIFLSAHKVKDLAAELAQHYGPDCPIAFVYRASWPDQQIILGTLEDIADKVSESGIKKTAMIIVGHALSRDIPASKLYDPTFSHEHRIGKKC
jgi:precorrin-4/cobalt-precorrin-4 C11-methyltransferase